MESTQMLNYGLAVQLLVGAFRSGDTLEGLPEASQPRSADDGYLIQDRLASAVGLSTYGWKVGLTTESSRQAAGMDEPMVGRLFTEYVWHSGATVQGVGQWNPGVEAEFAFVVGRPPANVTRPLTRDEAAATVDSCFLAFEIIGSRYADKTRAGWLGVIGDNAGGLGFVVGPEVGDWRALDFPSIRAEVTADGHPLAPSLTGAGRSHPLEVLGWFYACAARRRWRVAPGMVVSTGTCNVPKPIPLGKRIVGRFAGVGEVSCTIAS
jgi:2-keto-4-pentenoate hydratase